MVKKKIKYKSFGNKILLKIFLKGLGGMMTINHSTSTNLSNNLNPWYHGSDIYSAKRKRRGEEII